MQTNQKASDQNKNNFIRAKALSRNMHKCEEQAFKQVVLTFQAAVLQLVFLQVRDRPQF